MSRPVRAVAERGGPNGPSRAGAPHAGAESVSPSRPRWPQHRGSPGRPTGRAGPTSRSHQIGLSRALVALVALVAAISLVLILNDGATAQRRVPDAPALGGLGVHIVEPGETLYTLSRRYELTVGDLAQLNGVRRNAMLLPGRPLWVPLERAVNARAGEPAAASASAVASGTQATSGTGAGADIEAGADIQTTDEGGAETSNNTTAAASSPRRTYTVQPGDTLFSLGQRFGVDLEDLKRWNGLPPDGSLRAGETLIVSAPGAGNSATDGQAGDAGADASGPNGVVSVPDATHTEYVVQAGDTLSSIGRRFNTTASGLRRENGLTGDALYVGQVLRVPLQGAGPTGADGAKRIVVDLSDQRMYVYEGAQLVWNFVASTGIAGFPTRTGTFAVQSKIPNAWSGPWQLWMPSWLGIYWAGGTENGIHALPIVNGQRIWGGNLGSPISYGCVVLDTDAAAQLYEWADIGTPVVIRE